MLFWRLFFAIMCWLFFQVSTLAAILTIFCYFWSANIFLTSIIGYSNPHPWKEIFLTSPDSTSLCTDTSKEVEFQLVENIEYSRSVAKKVGQSIFGQLIIFARNVLNCTTRIGLFATIQINPKNTNVVPDIV